MNGHVKKMYFQQFVDTTATLLYFLLLLAVDPIKTVDASRNQSCGKIRQQTLSLTRLVFRETEALIKIYKASQGPGFQKSFCKSQVNIVPDPNISGLEPSERITSIYTQLQVFLLHLKWVHEQQMDLQPPNNPLLDGFTRVRDNSNTLSQLVKNFYKSLYPNLPLPEPAGGPTTLPPPQNIFQQKVYGCVTLTTYKKLLSNICKEKILRIKTCRMR